MDQYEKRKYGKRKPPNEAGPWQDLAELAELDQMLHDQEDREEYGDLPRRPPAAASPPPPPVDASRVLKALARDPALLFEVACMMGATKVAILGPWSDQTTKEHDPKSRITKINWVRRFDTTGHARVFICVHFRQEDDREVLERIEWAVYLKDGHKHLDKGECKTVLEAQRAADESARRAGWMLVD
jgi:hypothetical protein